MGNRECWKVLIDTKLIVNDFKGVTHAHLGIIWYHSETSDLPYSQFLGWDFFADSYSKIALVSVAMEGDPLLPSLLLLLPPPLPYSLVIPLLHPHTSSKVFSSVFFGMEPKVQDEIESSFFVS